MTAARPIEIAQEAFDLTNRVRERSFGTFRIGRSNKQIAEALFVSERTAQTHVQQHFDKMDVNTRAAAAALAVEHGIE
ncbi:MAG: LuxR C-terminal-related transcriptional regulator [Thermomicrobiales bacterium]